jgi:hypothetical protein
MFGPVDFVECSLTSGDLEILKENNDVPQVLTPKFFSVGGGD